MVGARKARVEGLIASGWSLLYSPMIPSCVAENVYTTSELSIHETYICKYKTQIISKCVVTQITSHTYILRHSTPVFVYWEKEPYNVPPCVARHLCGETNKGYFDFQQLENLYVQQISL
jgi:hypothetical protein